MAQTQVNLSKSAVIAILLGLAVIPWFGGGRDPVGWMILLTIGLLGGFIGWRRQGQLKLSWLGAAWLALVAWTCLSLIWSVNRYQTATTLLLYLSIGVLAAVVVFIRSNPAAENLFIKAYLAVAAITSVIGLVFFVIYSYERATSTFYLPNPLAAFLLPAIVIGLWLFIERKSLFGAMVTIINLGVFLLTDSRGGTLVLIVTLFLAFWLSPGWLKHWRRILIVLVGAISLALLGNVGRSQFSHQLALPGGRYQNLSTSTSTSDRIYYLKSALAIWSDRPIQGSGAGTYASLHPKYQYRVISAGSNAHNLYVQTLAELGLVGFGLLVWLLILLITGLIRGVRADPAKLPLALGALALILHAGIDMDSNFPVLWALVAILVTLTYLPSAKSRKLKLPTWSPFAASLILALPICWLFQGQIAARNGEITQGNTDYDKAIDYYQAATTHPPYDPDWLTAEGINHLLIGGQDRTGNLVKAASLAEAAIRQDPFDAQHDLLLGRVRLAQKRYSEAEAAYKSAIAKDPYNHPDYYNDLATLYLQQQKLTAATNTVQVVLGLYTDEVIANRNNDTQLSGAVSISHVIAAQAAIKGGQLDQARDHLRQALKLDPNSLVARFVLKQIGE